MATFNKVANFLYVLGRGQVNLTTDVMKVALYTNAWTTTSTAYSATNEVGNGNGYATGGATCTATGNIWTASAGTVYYSTVAATTWTSSTATWTFRYVVYYDATASGSPIVGWYDYGSDVTLSGPNGDTFTVTPASNTLFTLS